MAAEPLRLLWLIDSLTPGGAESLAVAFAGAARERNLDVTLVARTSIEGNALAPHVETLGARKLYDVAAFRRLLRIIRERRIQLVHAHLAYSAMWAGLASRITGVPAVATLHTLPSGGFRERLLVSLLNCCVKRVVFVSEAQRGAWMRVKRGIVIHNGVALAAPQSGGAANALPTVLTIAVLREGKGIDTLIDAAEDVQNAEFRIAGDGPLRAVLEERAKNLPIRFLGFRRDTRELLRECDLFVLPTLFDAFPTVLLEAMAEGKPCIASGVGGVPEILDSSCAILVPPTDPAALANAINRALGDAEWRIAAGRAARKRFEQHFTIDRWIDRLERLYAGVLR